MVWCMFDVSFAYKYSSSSSSKIECCWSNASVYLFACVRVCACAVEYTEILRYTHVCAALFTILNFELPSKSNLIECALLTKKKNYNLANGNLNLTARWKFDLNAYRFKTKPTIYLMMEKSWRKYNIVLFFFLQNSLTENKFRMNE